jgi:hypothetical protein
MLLKELTTAKLHSLDTNLCVDFTRLSSSPVSTFEQKEPNLTGELKWVSYRQSSQHSIQSVSLLLMTMSVCRSIQYETQQMGNVQRVATNMFSFGNNKIDFVYF